MKRLALPAVVVLTLLVVDQATKFLALKGLSAAFDRSGATLSAFYSSAPLELAVGSYHYPPKEPVVVSDSFFRLRYAENPGAAFGLFRQLPPALRGPFFHVVSVAAVVFISLAFLRLRGTPEERWARWGLPMVLAGALGNYCDRLARGFVIDFLEVHWFERAFWPAFNVADMAIVVGVACLFIDSFVRRETRPASKLQRAAES